VVMMSLVSGAQRRGTAKTGRQNEEIGLQHDKDTAHKIS
jgi:hypothetical protein